MHFSTTEQSEEPPAAIYMIFPAKTERGEECDNLIRHSQVSPRNVRMVGRRHPAASGCR